MSEIKCYLGARVVNGEDKNDLICPFDRQCRDCKREKRYQEIKEGLVDEGMGFLDATMKAKEIYNSEPDPLTTKETKVTEKKTVKKVKKTVKNTVKTVKKTTKSKKGGPVMKELDTKVENLRELMRQKEELENKIKEAQDVFKTVMGVLDVDELKGDDWKITWKWYTKNTMDTKTFKEDHPDLAEQYNKTTEYQKFLLS